MNIVQLHHDLHIEMAESKESSARAFRLHAALCLNPEYNIGKIDCRERRESLARGYAGLAESDERKALQHRATAAAIVMKASLA